MNAKKVSEAKVTRFLELATAFRQTLPDDEKVLLDAVMSSAIIEADVQAHSFAVMPAGRVHGLNVVNAAVPASFQAAAAAAAMDDDEDVQAHAQVQRAQAQVVQAQAAQAAVMDQVIVFNANVGYELIPTSALGVRA